VGPLLHQDLSPCTGGPDVVERSELPDRSELRLDLMPIEALGGQVPGEPRLGHLAPGEDPERALARGRHIGLWTAPHRRAA